MCMWNETFIVQEKIKSFIDRSVSEGTLPHAMLYYGPEGAGQLIHAIYTAQEILCQNHRNGPCGVCSTCKKVLQLTHPDLHFLLPSTSADSVSQDVYSVWRESVGSQPYMSAFQWMQALGADRKQGNINAKDCLRAYQNMNMQSYEGGPKVLIIWMAEYLGRDGNRLLKLIEEPPANTFLILVAENRERILQTILSRCQQMYFPPYAEHEVTRYLAHSKDLDATRSKVIVGLADGNLNEAYHLMAHSHQDYSGLFTDWIRASFQKDPSQRVKWVDQTAKISKEEQKQFIRFGMKMLRKAIHPGRNEQVDHSTHDEKVIRFLNDRLTIDQFDDLTTVMNKSIDELARNANPKIVWMHMSIKLNQHMHRQQTMSNVQS